MNLETINKWLDEEYGCSYTRLEELHDFYFEKYCDLQQENKQLKDNMRQMDNSIDKLQKQLIKEKDNWNKLKEWLEKELGDRINPNKDKWLTGVYDAYRETIDKMLELEQGSDSNVKD